MTLTSDGEINRDVTLSASAANVEVDIDFAFARLKSIYILSDAAITIKTNSSSSPDDTLTLVANQPLLWTAVDAAGNPFDTDVTRFFLTNGTTGVATVKIRTLYDSTP